MNIKTNVLEEYVNFVDNTKKQNNFFEIIVSLFAVIITFFFIFLLFKYNTKWYLCIYNNKNTVIRI